MGITEVLDDVKNWLGLSEDVKTAVNKFNNAEKVMTGFMKEMTVFLEQIQLDISKMQTDIKGNLPKLEDIEKYTKQTKGAIDTVNTTIASMHTTLNTAKNKIVSMAGDIESIPAMAGDIGTVKSQMTNVKNYLEDIKTKIADNLPQLKKLDDLSKLDTINTTLNNLKSSFENLDFGDLEVTLPEDLKVDFDDSAIVGQLKDLNDRFGSLDTKLNILEKVNYNLERQNATLEHGLNLLTQNMPLTQNFFDFFNKISEINNLTLSVLKLETQPLEFFENLNTILSQSLQWDIQTYKPPEFNGGDGPGPGPWPYPFPDPLKTEEKVDTLPEDIISMQNGDLILQGTKENIITGDRDTNISIGNSNIGPESSQVLGGEGIGIDPATPTGNIAIGDSSNIISTGGNQLIKWP